MSYLIDRADKQLTEIGGYATRLFSHYRPFNLAAFIASFSMIVMVSTSVIHDDEG